MMIDSKRTVKSCWNQSFDNITSDNCISIIQSRIYRIIGATVQSFMIKLKICTCSLSLNIFFISILNLLNKAFYFLYTVKSKHSEIPRTVIYLLAYNLIPKLILKIICPENLFFQKRWMSLIRKIWFYQSFGNMRFPKTDNDNSRLIQFTKTHCTETDFCSNAQNNFNVFKRNIDRSLFQRNFELTIDNMAFRRFCDFYDSISHKEILR